MPTRADLSERLLDPPIVRGRQSSGDSSLRPGRDRFPSHAFSLRDESDLLSLRGSASGDATEEKTLFGSDWRSRKDLLAQHGPQDLLHAPRLARDASKDGQVLDTGLNGIVKRKMDSKPARKMYVGKLGIDFVVHHSSAAFQRDKILKYQQTTVANRPIATAVVQHAATVFDFPGVKSDMVLALAVSWCFTILSLAWKVDRENMGASAVASLTDIGGVVSQARSLDLTRLDSPCLELTRRMTWLRTA
jgi:hypothetical protein